MKSKYICRRCELAVGLWASGEGSVWKHHGNLHRRSCGKTPLVVERAKYEAEMEAFARDAESMLEGLFESRELFRG